MASIKSPFAILLHGMSVEFKKQWTQFNDVIRAALKHETSEQTQAEVEKFLATKILKKELVHAEEPEDDGEDGEKKAEKKEKITQDAKTFLEYAMRFYVAELSSGFQGKSSNEISDSGVEQILDLSIGLATKDLIEPSLSFLLIEDLLDSQTIDTCEQLFSLIESRASKFSDPLFLSQKPKVVLLRLCIEFLRRLSKSDNTALGGRILMFLAYVFPLSDRSGLNVKSESNVANITETDLEEQMQKDSMELENGQEEPIDFNFYRTFWGLQYFFQNPSVVLSTNSKWAELVKSLDHTLNAFASNSHFEVPEDKDQEVYFTKYLTSSKLMKLELRDVNFRIQILIQMLVLFQTLEVPTKPTDQLNERQRPTLLELKMRVKDLLEQTPNGKELTKNISSIIQREVNWIMWKRDGCKPYERQQVSKAQHKRGRMESTQELSESKKIKMGNPHLSRLWNIDVGNDVMLQKDLVQMPSLQEYLKPLEEQLAPDSGIEEQYKLKNNKVYTWKALRLVAKHKLPYFSKLADGNLEDIFGLLEKENQEKTTQSIPQTTSAESPDV